MARTVTVKSSGGNYSSLSAAFGGEVTDLQAAGYDPLNIDCYALSDTYAADTGSSSGWNADSTHYINISAVAAARHSGKWDSSKYNLVINDSMSSAITCRPPYSRYTGLQVKNSGTASAVSTPSTSTTDLLIDRCIFIGGAYGYYHCGNNLGTIRNSILIGNSGPGLSTYYSLSGTTNIYNCTIITYYTSGNAVALKTSTGVTMKNCYAATPNSSGDSYGTGIATKTTCASDDSTGSTGLTSIAYSTSNFVGVTQGSEDLHLVSGSALINVGTDLSASFTLDIDGETRPTGANTWDIGVDEYISTVTDTPRTPTIGSITASGVAARNDRGVITPTEVNIS